MLGSSASVSTPNIVLNTAVAEGAFQFYTELEGTKPEDMESAVYKLLKRAPSADTRELFSTETAIQRTGLQRQKNVDFITWPPHRNVFLPL